MSGSSIRLRFQECSRFIIEALGKLRSYRASKVSPLLPQVVRVANGVVEYGFSCGCAADLLNEVAPGRDGLAPDARQITRGAAHLLPAVVRQQRGVVKLASSCVIDRSALLGKIVTEA
jgi:hypothetical protein